MSSFRHSTNERALARHNALSKRFPAAAGHAANNDDDNDPLAAILGLGDDDGDSTTPVAHTTPNPTAVTVLPPLGTNSVTKAVIPTTGANIVSKLDVSSSVSKIGSVPTLTSASSSSSSPSSLPPSSVSNTVHTTPTSSLVSTAGVLGGDRGVSSASSATPSPKNSASGSTSSSSSQGLSSGTIGGIVAALLIFALAVAAFFVRKYYQRRRAIKRNTWGAGLVPSLETKRQSLAPSNQAPLRPTTSPQIGTLAHERLANVPPASEMLQTPVRGATYQPSTPSTILTPTSRAYAVQGPPGLTQPASSYNPALTPPPISPFTAASVPTTSRQSMGPAAASTGDLAVVVRTFIPSLPDELHIATGEQIRVLSAYDDGWALCANGRGDQGVVPLECLDRREMHSVEMQLQPQSAIGEPNRTSRRISSLAPVTPGTY